MSYVCEKVTLNTKPTLKSISKWINDNDCPHLRYTEFGRFMVSSCEGEFEVCESTFMLYGEGKDWKDGILKDERLNHAYLYVNGIYYWVTW